MSEGRSASQELKRRAPAALLGLSAIALYGVITVFALFHGQTFAAEVSALVRGWWYALGLARPYAGTDLPTAMPLYFYEIGYWQRLVGQGHVAGRALSIVLGAASGVLLFSICRRLTANTAVAAAAVFIFLATPSTSYFFATATSAATVAVLHLLAVWIIVISMGRPRAYMSALMGLVCAALYFLRQDMALGVVVLIPLYIAAVGRGRALQALIVLGVLAVTAALVIAAFPAKFHLIALKLPLIGGALGDAGLLGPDYTLLSRGTHGPSGLGAALEISNLQGFLESFVLPNLGTIAFAVALFAAAAGPLKVLWIAPLYFLWLAFTHYVDFSAKALCETCMLPATPTFAAVGALAAALTLAMSGRMAKRSSLSAGTIVAGGAVIAVALNAFAPMLAAHPQAKSFPAPMLNGLNAPAELTYLPALTAWAAAEIKSKDSVLVLHGLGRTDVAALPYAVVAAGHRLAPVSLDLAEKRRTINQSLVGDMRESVRAAVEADGLWSEEILRRWIARDYNVILLQDDTSVNVAAIKKEIETRFDQTGQTRYRGSDILLFTRKPAQ